MGRRILGKIPEEAIQGSYQEEKPKETAQVAGAHDEVSLTTTTTADNLNDQALIEQEIAHTIFSEYEETNLKTDEDLFNEIISAKDSVKYRSKNGLGFHTSCLIRIG